ncbi:MAG: tyrosine-protein phosphatase [Eubacteriaceae bacterium]|nr:tyrosine-protein phosphatase [Eubacteriaceae bacterium]
MARTVRPNQPLKLDGARNCRDLGGYPTKYGVNTATGQFLRCDNPSKFTEEDLTRVYDYGVRLQIDFRSEDEATGESASKLKDYKDVEYMINPMLGDVSSDDAVMALPDTLGDMYIDFLDNKRGSYLKPLRAILQHMDDCVFFNCTAGKDRTGTFAMIILKLAGVPDEVIVTDYAPSGDNIWEDMKASYNRMTSNPNMGEEAIEKLRNMFASRPVEMQRALAHLKYTYGTIEDWMLLVGLTMDEISQLRNKILGCY